MTGSIVDRTFPYDLNLSVDDDLFLDKDEYNDKRFIKLDGRTKMPCAQQSA